MRQTVEAFGLAPVILPDISGSLDGTVPDRWVSSTYGGTPIADIESLGGACHCIAIGEHMRRPAEALRRKTGLAYTLLPTLTGLAAADRLVAQLSRLSGRPVPAAIRRRRSQLQDAMLDGHFHFGGRKVAVAAEPDLLYQMAAFFAEMGAETTVAIAATPDNPILAVVPAEVTVGDLGDLEERAAGVDLLVSHAHGRQASERLGVPAVSRRLSNLRPARRAAPAQRSLRGHARPDLRGREHPDRIRPSPSDPRQPRSSPQPGDTP